MLLEDIADFKPERKKRHLPSSLLTWGSTSTSCRCSCVYAWNSRRVLSSLTDNQTPSPTQHICRTWLSCRGCASNDVCSKTT